MIPGTAGGVPWMAGKSAGTASGLKDGRKSRRTTANIKRMPEEHPFLYGIIY